MKVTPAQNDKIELLVDISKRAFDSDALLKGAKPGGPPEYDCVKWHETMSSEKHLFQAEEDGSVVGGAVLFFSEDGKQLYVGRIFIAPACHRKGYGKTLMSCIEKIYPNVEEIHLDTPVWNVRTNTFYKVLGYTVDKTDGEFVYYKKIILADRA